MYKELEDISNYCAGWDGYGCCKISEKSIQTAKSIIHIIELNHLPIPQIVPQSGGSIMFVWPNVELEAVSDGTIDYYVVVDQSKLHKLGNTLRYILL